MGGLEQNISQNRFREKGDKIMGIILEIVGVIGIIVGVIISLTGVGLPVGISIIFGGMILFAIGSTNRTVKKIREDLKEIKIWLQAKK